jgi:hypothetical protein
VVIAMTSRFAALALALTLAVAGCGSGSPGPRGTSSGTPPSPAPSASGTAGSGEWPFVLTACADAPGDPLLLVALGTSETAGWRVRDDETYSPQEAYPARHAMILCTQLERPVELHSYFPSQDANTLAPVAWWRDVVDGDQQVRADLADAGLVDLWALDSHNAVDALIFRGCSGEWPRPLKKCLQKAFTGVLEQMDRVFGTVDSLVDPGVNVLAADAFIPPGVLETWGDEPYWKAFNAIADPRFRVSAAAENHDFIFVDTELVLNGRARHQVLGPDLIQSDGLHLTAKGQQMVAEAFAVADGLG